MFVRSVSVSWRNRCKPTVGSALKIHYILRLVFPAWANSVLVIVLALFNQNTYVDAPLSPTHHKSLACFSSHPILPSSLPFV